MPRQREIKLDVREFDARNVMDKPKFKRTPADMRWTSARTIVVTEGWLFEVFSNPSIKWVTVGSAPMHYTTYQRPANLPIAGKGQR